MRLRRLVEGRIITIYALRITHYAGGAPMLLERAELYHIAMPLVTPFETSAYREEVRQTGQSLRALLGGARDRVPVGVSVGIQPSLDALLATVGAYRDQGYGRIKIKVKPGWLAAPVRALRAAFGPDLPLQVDANSAFTLADAPLLQEIDDAGLLLIEQPLADDDLVDHATLQAQLRTPLCLDESIGSYAA